MPDALGWDTRSALLGWRLHGNDVEAVSHALERLVGEDSFRSLLGILQEDRHFCLGIAFCHVGDVDTLGGIGSLLQGFVRSRLIAHLMDEDVLWSHLMGERCHHLASVVAQVNGDVYRILWHRHEEYVFETLCILL